MARAQQRPRSYRPSREAADVRRERISYRTQRQTHLHDSVRGAHSECELRSSTVSVRAAASSGNRGESKNPRIVYGVPAAPGVPQVCSRTPRRLRGAQHARGRGDAATSKQPAERARTHEHVGEVVPGLQAQASTFDVAAAIGTQNRRTRRRNRTRSDLQDPLATLEAAIDSSLLEPFRGSEIGGRRAPRLLFRSNGPAAPSEIGAPVVPSAQSRLSLSGMH